MDFEPYTDTGIVGKVVSPEPHAEARRANYTMRDIRTATGQDGGKLQNHFSRGLFSMETELNPGPGKDRQFSASEVVRVALMNAFADGGMPLADAFKLSVAVQKTWDSGNATDYSAWAQEPTFACWLVIFKASAIPEKFQPEDLKAGGYCAVLTIENLLAKQSIVPRPFGSSRSLAEVLRAASAMPAIVIDAGRFFEEIWSRLDAVILKRKARQKPLDEAAG